MMNKHHIAVLLAVPTLLTASASWAVPDSAQLSSGKWRILAQDDWLAEGESPNWRDGVLDTESFDFRVPGKCKRVQMNVWAETPTESPDESGLSWSKATFTRPGRNATSSVFRLESSNGYRAKSRVFKQKTATAYRLEVTTDYLNPGPFSSDYWSHDYQLWARCK